MKEDGLTGPNSEFQIFPILSIVYRFNMISSPLIYDLNKVVLIHLFMTVTKTKNTNFSLEVKLF